MIISIVADVSLHQVNFAEQDETCPDAYLPTGPVQCVNGCRQASHFLPGPTEIVCKAKIDCAAAITASTKPFSYNADCRAYGVQPQALVGKGASCVCFRLTMTFVFCCIICAMHILSP